METTVPLPVETSYEELLSRFVESLETERTSWWLSAEIVATAVRDVTRKERRVLLGAFAQAGRCSVAHVRNLGDIGAAFGREYQKPDIPVSMYRSCVNAAKRTKRSAQEILTEALANDQSAADVNALGTPKKRTLGLTKTCDACGSRISIRIGGAAAKSFRHAAVPCPVCVWTAWEDGRDAKEAEKLGALA